jgi:hypothetical protein
MLAGLCATRSVGRAHIGAPAGQLRAIFNHWHLVLWLQANALLDASA